MRSGIENIIPPYITFSLDSGAIDKIIFLKDWIIFPNSGLADSKSCINLVILSLASNFCLQPSAVLLEQLRHLLLYIR